MGFGGSKQPTLQEQLQTSKREIQKAIRELDRERRALENEEQDLLKQLRAAAERGNMTAAEAISRNLVRTRRHCAAFYDTRSQLRSVQLQLQTVSTTHAMSDTLKNVSNVMANLNAAINLPSLRQAMSQFNRETAKLGVTHEMMSEAVEDNAGAEDPRTEEQESRQALQKVLEEISSDMVLQTAGFLPPTTLPNNSGGGSAPASQLESSVDQRLKELSKAV